MKIDNFFNWFKNLFNKEETINQIQPKTINTIEIYDDVWVKEDDILYKGWISNKSNSIIEVVVEKYDGTLKEETFHIKRPLTTSILEDDNKILILDREAIN